MTLMLAIHHLHRLAAVFAHALLMPRLQSPGDGHSQPPCGQGLLVHRDDR